MGWRVFPCARCTPRNRAGRRCLGGNGSGGGAAVGEAECGVFRGIPAKINARLFLVSRA